MKLGGKFQDESAGDLIGLATVHTQAFPACSLVYAEYYLGSNPSPFELKDAD
jgi:hypothetical protein